MIDPSMVRKLQKDLTDRMARIKDELKTKEAVGTAGGGVVTVVANGNSEIISVTIKAEAIDPTDAETLQDLVIAATNHALEKSRALHEDSVSNLTGGLHFPGLF